MIAPILDPEGADAKCAGCILIVAHRHQLRAEAGVADPPDDGKGGKGHQPDDPEEALFGSELEVGGSLVERDQDADAGTGEVHGVGQDAQHLGKGERHQREIGPAQSVAEG